MKNLLKIALVAVVLVNLTACVEYNEYYSGGYPGYYHHHHQEVVVSSGYVENYPRHHHHVEVFNHDEPVYVHGSHHQRVYVNDGRPRQSVSVSHGVVFNR